MEKSLLIILLKPNGIEENYVVSTFPQYYVGQMIILKKVDCDKEIFEITNISHQIIVEEVLNGDVIIEETVFIMNVKLK